MIVASAINYAKKCTAGSSSIPNLEDATAGGTARTGAKWDSDGSVYWREGSPSWGSAQSSWIGNCANSKYEGRWVRNSGDSPDSSSGSDGVWHDMTSDVTVSYLANSEELRDGNFTFELRRKSDGVVILTDTFSMYAEDEGEF